MRSDLVKRRSMPRALRHTRFLSKLSPPHLRSSGPFLDVSSRVHCTGEGEFGALVMAMDSAIKCSGISLWFGVWCLVSEVEVI